MIVFRLNTFSEFNSNFCLDKNKRNIVVFSGYLRFYEMFRYFSQSRVYKIGLKSIINLGEKEDLSAMIAGVSL